MKVWLKPFLVAQRVGAGIQMTGFAVLAVQNFLAPGLFGPHQYGLAISILTMAYLFQGLWEPVANTLTVRLAGSGAIAAQALRDIREVWIDATLFLLVGVVVLIGYTYLFVKPNEPDGFFIPMLLAVLMLAVTFCVTALIAITFAIHEHSTVFRGMVGAAVVSPVAIWILREQGAAGLIGALCLVQLVVAFPILRSTRVRAVASQIIKSIGAPTAGAKGRGVRRREYFDAVAPRVASIILTTVTVLLCGAMLLPSAVAEYKLTLSLIGAGIYLLPVSPTVFQASLGALLSRGSRATHSAAWGVLAAIFVLGCVVAAILFAVGAELRAWILSVEVSARDQYNSMFLAMPFFMLINVLGAYLFAVGRQTAMRAGLFSTAAAVAILFAAGKPQFAFVIGTISFVVFSSAIALLSRKMEMS